jgi:sarcosine oxidase subunit alpha
MSNVTSGPIVNESLETNIEGVFACGNVLHVHDLVDYVTQESYNAGKCAAQYINGKNKSENSIKIKGIGGVRYTVPSYINEDNVEKEVMVRFRVGSVFKNEFISVYFDNERVMHIKKRILTPGEMESVKLSKTLLTKYPNCENITIKVEKE